MSSEVYKAFTCDVCKAHTRMASHAREGRHAALVESVPPGWLHLKSRLTAPHDPHSLVSVEMDVCYDCLIKSETALICLDALQTGVVAIPGKMALTANAGGGYSGPGSYGILNSGSVVLGIEPEDLPAGAVPVGFPILGDNDD